MENSELRRILKEKGIKQTWLAEKLFITKAQVNQWVNNATTIPDKYISDLNRLLK